MESSTNVTRAAPDDFDASIPLDNARHEAFCQNLAIGMPRPDAWISAGYSDNRNAAYADACRLLVGNAKVALRVRYLKDQAAERAMVNASDVVRLAMAIAEDPDANPNARVSALALLAKQFPEFSDKVDARVLHGIVKVERGTRGLSAG